ncbi:MAG: hypothetical protein JWM20_647 [Patescibacteria group bacterium]|nr:hypothetical protein [Patescibacteria group bacterium]
MTDKQRTTAVVISGVLVAIVFFGAGFAIGHHANARGGAGAYGRTGMAAGGARGGFGAAGGAGSMRMRAGGFANGTILSMTDTSITVSLQNGGSQTIYFTNSTPVLKSVTGTTTDLKVGDMITATGTPAADGSIAAQSVTIRPAGSMPMGGMPSPAGGNPVQ